MTAFGLIFVQFVFILASMLQDETEAQEACHSLSVVVFFTDSSEIPGSSSGMKFLEMGQMARVKHDIPVQPFVAKRNTPNCKGILREGLTSLKHFCQNALGMKTAIVSVTSKETNTCDSPPQSQQRETRQKSHENYPSNPIIKKEASPKSPRVDRPGIITDPEHQEVFNIRVKRNEGSFPDKKPRAIPDFSFDGKRTKPPWDVLDVMSHVRFSFFGSLFEDGTVFFVALSRGLTLLLPEKKKKLSKEEDGLLSNLIGRKKQDPGLFDTVRSTLATLQETPGEAFLMVVFGGHLSEICDKQSALIQSLKHVTEVTDPASTLIVTTGDCPVENRRGIDDVVVIKEDFRNGHPGNNLSSVLPVYAKGPKSERLTECTVLYDIPLVIKNILEEYSPTFGDQSKEKIRQKRTPRLILETLRSVRSEGYRKTHFEYGTLQMFVIVSVIPFVDL